VFKIFCSVAKTAQITPIGLMPGTALDRLDQLILVPGKEQPPKSLSKKDSVYATAKFKHINLMSYIEYHPINIAEQCLSILEATGRQFIVNNPLFMLSVLALSLPVLVLTIRILLLISSNIPGFIEYHILPIALIVIVSVFWIVTLSALINKIKNVKLNITEKQANTVYMRMMADLEPQSMYMVRDTAPYFLRIMQESIQSMSYLHNTLMDIIPIVLSTGITAVSSLPTVLRTITSGVIQTPWYILILQQINLYLNQNQDGQAFVKKFCDRMAEIQFGINLLQIIQTVLTGLFILRFIFHDFSNEKGFSVTDTMVGLASNKVALEAAGIMDGAEKQLEQQANEQSKIQTKQHSILLISILFMFFFGVIIAYMACVQAEQALNVPEQVATQTPINTIEKIWSFIESGNIKADMGISITHLPMIFAAVCCSMIVKNMMHVISEVVHIIDRGANELRILDTLKQKIAKLRVLRLTNIGRYEPLRLSPNSLIYNNASVSYDAKVPVVSGVTFRMSAGRCNFIMGLSGVGKTTSVTAPCFLYCNVDGKGSILATDGVRTQDVTKVHPQQIQGIMSICAQNCRFTDTNGLTLGEYIQSKVDVVLPQDIIHGIMSMGLSKTIEQAKELMQKPLGDNASLFSGGERNRLMILIELLKRKPFLVLDETLDNVDGPTKQKILIDLLAYVKANDICLTIISHNGPELVQLCANKDMRTLKQMDVVFIKDEEHTVTFNLATSIADGTAEQKMIEITQNTSIAQDYPAFSSKNSAEMKRILLETA
jgi:ABC-type multidrug transport system fused ATPase/permease subunit